MSVYQQNCVRLSDLPLFRDIKEALMLEKQHQQNKTHRPTNGAQIVDKNKSTPRNQSGIRHQYIPPLSAYNAAEERPYFPMGTRDDKPAFDELTMRTDRARQSLKSVRTLGWDLIQPIGIRHTMRQLREQQKDHEGPSKVQASNNMPLPLPMQENGNEPIDDFHDLGHETADAGTPSAQQASAEPEEEDGDLSYDYDAEFARVEDEEEEEERADGIRGTSMPFGAGNPLTNRGTERDITIQQFVETSHVERHPYDSEDEYGHSQLNLDPDQGESREFMEVPWVEVSDTVESVNSRRISSLNSLSGHIIGGQQDSRHDL